jgi:hypothetical protein
MTSTDMHGESRIRNSFVIIGGAAMVLHLPLRARRETPAR